MSSLFASRAYYAFGFLALTSGVMGLTTATVSILFTYFMLCAEEYRFDKSFELNLILAFSLPTIGGTGEHSWLEAAMHSGSSSMESSIGHLACH